MGDEAEEGLTYGKLLGVDCAYRQTGRSATNGPGAEWERSFQDFDAFRDQLTAEAINLGGEGQKTR
jgi:hypothetical protein